MSSRPHALDVIAADDPFWPLLEASLRGEIRAEELQRFESRLQTDDAARRMYFDLCRVEADLQFVLRGARTDERLAALIAADTFGENTPADEPAMIDGTAEAHASLWEQFVDRFNKPLTAALSIATLTITIILLSLALWIIPAVAPQAPENALVARPTFVAQLVAAPDAAWTEATAAELEEGRDLYVGQALELTAGSAEIRYDSGVRVRLFAPARWTIPSAQALDMQQGRAVARVTPSAVGFTIGTPLCDVIDLGTEFAVGCDPAGDVNVYVHDGEVEVAPANTGRKHVRLTTGQSLTVSRDGGSEIADTVRQKELKRLALASGVTNNIETWQIHRDEWKADESLIAYYDFQRDAERPDALVNIAEATAGKLHGQLGDPALDASQPTWSEGRFRGKGALKFDGAKSQFVRITPAEPIDYAAGITVAMWVRFDGPVTQPVVLAAQREGSGPYAFQLAAMPNGHGSRGIQFLSGHAATTQGGYSGEAVDYGDQWQLLVVSSNEHETIFYRNGRQIGRAEGTLPAASASPISVGVNFQGGANLPAYPLNGAIDELMIFYRAIAPSEVSQLFAAGRP